MKPFHFKQFSIYQEHCAMKVSLDACLFGALCHVEAAKNILDIGTGTGLLALMAAQRSMAQIDAVELDEKAARQAQDNVHKSPFLSHINVHNKNIMQYRSSHNYDVILCNPPFFSNHLKGPDTTRNLARHNDGLSFFDLSQCLSLHLSKNGSAWILLPCSEFDSFMHQATQCNLVLFQQFLISSRPQKKPHRVVFSLKHLHKDLNKIEPAIKEISIHQDNGPQYSPAFESLLSDFYLKL